jgi:O-antigen/teichoic acid export membrane protein
MPGPPEAAVPDDGETISRNFVYGLAAQLVGAAFTAALTIYLVRALGPAGYGVFALAVGISTVLLLPSDFGISQSAGRFIAERRDDSSAISAVIGLAVRLKVLAAGAVSVGLVALAAPIASAYDAPGLAWPLRAVAIALFGQSLMVFSMTTFVALQRIPMTFRVVVSESAMEFTATLTLVLLSGGATAAAFGRAVGFAFGALVGLALIVRALGRPALRLRGRSPVGARRLAGYAGALLIIDGAFALFNQIDILLIGAILGTTSAGLFSAPLRLVPFLGYPGLATANAVAPRMSRHPDRLPDVGSLQAALRYLVILQTGMATVTLVWADPIVELTLGPDYRESAEVLRAASPFVFLAGLAPLVSLAINYVGEARRRVPIAIGAVALNAGIDLALISNIGIVAGAIGTDVAYAGYVGAHVWLCRRMLGLRLRPVTATFARSLPAAAAMAAVLLAMGTGDLGVVEWIGGTLGGTAAFLTGLALTRELSPGELRAGIGSIVAGVREVRA